ncbi:MAG: hypothetical protein A3G76_11670 [Acidobacteria bacterium RIFCSPLOWO2_12_FULL_65_11]|nr:MAG: hypothetical protein A3H95_11820 [Acidobacteria bacterium RIFCSPLOWO2_02_FULL_64_15]OFW32929.1 MAG: hypothetical protein A3G76_11670 [Acidobacteria bacterium RIFCSPLOWO2_12_FULL_65_11]
MATIQKICAAALAIALTTVGVLAREQGSGAAPAAGQATARVAVGVVCEGGMLLPIARRSQGAWRSLTDDEKAEVGVPLKLTSEATSLPRAGWTIVPFDANVTSRILNLEGSAVVDDASACTDQEGFRTDAPANARSRRPTDFIGIAVMGRVMVERVETVQHLPDPSSRRVGSLVVQLVQALEAERVEASATGRFVPSASQRARTPVDLDNMWRHRHGENDWYYFAAQKDYTNFDDTGNTLVKGWIVAAASGNGASLMKVGVSVGNALDGVTVQTHALGVLRVDDRAIWILDELTYESRKFELVDIPSSQRQPVCILRGC